MTVKLSRTYLERLLNGEFSLGCLSGYLSGDFNLWGGVNRNVISSVRHPNETS